MKDISQEIRGDVLTNRVNLLRATVIEAAVLKNLLNEQVVLGYSKIVVDLSQCTHLDSTFIGVLVVTQKKLLAKGGELKIVDPLDPAKELFYLTGISNVFETFNTSEEAVKSFNDNVKPKPEETIPEVDNNKNKNTVKWAFAQ